MFTCSECNKEQHVNKVISLASAQPMCSLRKQIKVSLYLFVYIYIYIYIYILYYNLDTQGGCTCDNVVVSLSTLETPGSRKHGIFKITIWLSTLGTVYASTQRSRPNLGHKKETLTATNILAITTLSASTERLDW